MSNQRPTGRIVLRLEPFAVTNPALHSIAQLAGALRRELAARLIEDERLSSAMAFAAQGPGRIQVHTGLHKSERALRRMIEEAAATAQTQWSFDVVRCAGILAEECALHSDDLLAIALPHIERSMEALRSEIAGGLSRAGGVLISHSPTLPVGRPVVGVVTGKDEIATVVPRAIELAQALGSSLAFLIGDDDDLFAQVRAAVAAQWAREPVALRTFAAGRLDALTGELRHLRPGLVVAEIPPDLLQELLASPRILRTIGVPLLLLARAA